MLIGTHSEREDLGGGRHRLTLHLGPIAYRDANNQLRRITNALGASGDPLLPIGVDELVQFRIRDKLSGSSPVIHFGKGQTYVRITPLGTNNTNGVVDGQSITFPEAWDNADYKVTVAGHRLQKDILLKTGHLTQFAFRIDSHAGLNPDTLETADFRILQPVLRDPATGFDEPLKWVVSQQGGKTVLTVTLPPGDHAGKVLDPTLTLQPDEAAGLDTIIYLYSPTTNYGADSFLGAGESTGIGSPDNGVWRILIKFSGISQIPATATIISATLSVWLFAGGTAYASNNRTLRLHRIRDGRDWVEDQATWNIYKTGNNWTTAGCGSTESDREATAIGSHDMLTTDAIDSQHDFALTPGVGGVQDWVSGALANNGMICVADTELDDLYAFKSSDHATVAQRPKLVVEYTVTVPTVTTQAADQIGPTNARGNGNITDDGGAAITEHGVCWKKGADPVNIAGSDGYTEEGAGAEGPFTSDMAGLDPESTYYYRAYATNSEGTSYGAAQSFKTMIVAAASGQAASSGSAAGVLELLASAEGEAIASAAAAPLLALVGAASGQGASEGAVNGRLQLIAAAEGEVVSSATAVAFIGHQAAAEGQTTSQGSAYALLALVGETEGQAVASGSASGIFELLAHAVGAALATATAIAILALLGGTSGEAVSSGSANGCLQLLSSAEGQGTSTAVAGAFVGHRGDAEGQSSSAGTAYALLGLAAVAEGAAATTGEIAGLLDLVAGAEGEGTTTATSEGILDLVAAAEGQGTSQGAASGLLALIGEAEGQGTTTGTVVIVLPFFLGDLGPGQTIVIDCEYETVTIDGVNVLKDFVGEFLKLPPGTSILKYADLEDSRDLTITITYKDKWI